MVNLLVIGKATSNLFDGTILLGDDTPEETNDNTKRLKGLTEPTDIGHLSLFEHYNAIQVFVASLSTLF